MKHEHDFKIGNVLVCTNEKFEQEALSNRWPKEYIGLIVIVTEVDDNQYDREYQVTPMDSTFSNRQFYSSGYGFNKTEDRYKFFEVVFG